MSWALQSFIRHPIALGTLVFCDKTNSYDVANGGEVEAWCLLHADGYILFLPLIF
jgi:hypothetical protein